MSFDDFYVTTWKREKESKRKKEPQIPRLKLQNFNRAALLLNEESLFISIWKKRSVFVLQTNYM